MNLDPLKSTLSYQEIGETSLAVPSDGASHSGQRRVKEQVTTMTRSKHKYSTRGSLGTLSPSSPKSDSVFYEFKYSPTTLNGSAFANDSSMANGTVKMKQQKSGMMQRSVSTKSANYQWNQSNPLLHHSQLHHSLPSQNYSSIQPDLYSPAINTPGNAAFNTRYSQSYKRVKNLDRHYSQNFDRQYSQLPLNNPSQINASNTIKRSSNSHQISAPPINSQQPFSTQSNPEIKPSVPRRAIMKINGINGDISLKEAVNWLLIGDDNYRLRGASFIQHSTFTDDKAKAEVRKLDGIDPLVSLLRSSNPQIQQATASALRNIVFKDSANKEEVRRLGGVNEALRLLQDTDSAETQKHVTGLLWNLSSADSAQPELLRQALPVLTEKVLEPYANFSNIITDSDLCSESFYHATGCLRNLSSGKLSNRQALRNCTGLIDSLINHVQSCTDDGVLNNKSVENCVCVLHNLTYQLETEAPTVFSKLNSFAKASESRNDAADTGPIGCFSNQSRKIQQDSNMNYPQMDVSNPKGKDQLIQTQTLRSYLTLLASSENTETQEACCGILHNLTAKKGIVSDVMSQTIVQKLNGTQNLIPLLESPNANLKNAVNNLLGNLSRNPRLQKIMARQSLPDVVNSLNSSIKQGVDHSPDSDSALASACHTADRLLRAEPEIGKKVLSSTLISSLTDISLDSSLPKASTAAGVLLHNLWSDKTIQPFLKRSGMGKKSFVNEATLTALKSVQVID